MILTQFDLCYSCIVISAIMPERELPQSVQDAQDAERRDQLVFDTAEMGIGLFFLAGGFYLLRNGEYAAAMISFLAVAGDGAAFEIKRYFYNSDKQRKIRELPEPQPNPQVELVPRI